MWKFIHKWKTFKTDTNPPRNGHPSKFTPRSETVIRDRDVTLRDMADNPRTTPQTLQASVNMLNDKIVLLEKYGTSMACLEGLPEESLFSKKAWQHSLGLQSCIWTNHKISRTMSFEQIRPKWRCLAIMRHVWWKLKSISTQTPHTKSHTCWWRADDLGLVL